MSSSRRDVIRALAALGVAPLLHRTANAAAQEQPATIRVDYAYYNPSSLVLRRFGWLEEALADAGITTTAEDQAAVTALARLDTATVQAVARWMKTKKPDTKPTK